MNQIILKGTIRDIEYSHSIGEVEYNKANIIVPRNDGTEDILSLKFKKYSNVYEDGQEVALVGNVRSYSKKFEDGKSKVEIYVFTYFDIPELDENDNEVINKFELDGKVCKVDKLRTDKDGKESLHFIVANNIFINDGQSKIDVYLPCVCFGQTAKELCDLNIGQDIKLTGELHSRTYKKYLDNDEMEIRTAHEAIIETYEMLN